MHLESLVQPLPARKLRLCVPFKSDAARILKIFLKQYVIVAIAKPQEMYKHALSSPTTVPSIRS